MKTIYEVVIGLEIHAQMSTKTKMFCRCDNDSFNKEPNINTCEICMGFPGTLPCINKEAVKKAVIAALALHCVIPEHSKFDRKNYFYPDLPKGFQISQYDVPVSLKGWIEIEMKEGIKKIGITRLHMEDDAGKLTHAPGGTLCDYNRSGTPLMEIVSEPDMHSSEEAVAYAKEIQKILRYVGSSECDMEKGMMRFDINISIRPKGIKEFGIKVEVKNLNSFRSLERAIEYEIKRQTEAVECGERIIQETRGWDDIKGVTESQRTKEEAQDYRYFPEPDLPPLIQKNEEIEMYKKNIPELPRAKKKRYEQEFKLSDEEARILTEELDRALFFEHAATISKDPKKTAQFMNSMLLGHLNEKHQSLGECKISPENLGKLILLINNGKISHNLAKGKIFTAMFETGMSAEEIMEEKGLEELSDKGALENLAKKIIAENPKIVEQYKNGKTTVIGFFVGQMMQKTKGAANPKMVQDILKELLGAET
ncbi:Asp-tRNA(Asn)/Glu-tRNA(Gln) amidotransferase subunit GatB [Candidatus Peregrinibacteria bacterium]|nr:Asp-tRNA(Asn)/Glu-tRNA(Gln) amidotransferase subunit GatB [Candidatus Peregrinibacteria bacterium]